MSLPEWTGTVVIRPSMPELLVGAALAYFTEAERFKERDEFAGLQGRDAPHGSGDLEGMCPDELRFDLGLTIFKEEVNNLTEVHLEFVECPPLRMGARPPRNVAHEDPGVGVSLNNRGEGAHGKSAVGCG